MSTWMTLTSAWRGAAKKKRHLTPVPSNPDKFRTTKRQHEESVKKYGPLKTHRRPKRSMAMDPADLQDWIDRNGPYLYHNTSPDASEAILKEGLLPRAVHGRSNYYGWLSSRPNHVYLGTQSYVSGGSLEGAQLVPPLRVDLRKLDPDTIDIDEDWGHHRQFNQNKTPEGFLHAYESQSLGSLGDWADRHSDFLDQPEHVRQSLERGSVAVRGGVPADAIEPNPDYEGESRDDDYEECPSCGNYDFEQDPNSTHQNQWHCNNCGYEATDHTMNELYDQGIYPVKVHLDENDERLSELERYLADSSDPSSATQAFWMAQTLAERYPDFKHEFTEMAQQLLNADTDGAKETWESLKPEMQELGQGFAKGLTNYWFTLTNAIEDHDSLALSKAVEAIKSAGHTHDPSGLAYLDDAIRAALQGDWGRANHYAESARALLDEDYNLKAAARHTADAMGSGNNWYDSDASTGENIDPEGDITSDGDWTRGRFQLCPDCKKRHPKNFKCPSTKGADGLPIYDQDEYPYPGYTLASHQEQDPCDVLLLSELTTPGCIQTRTAANHDWVHNVLALPLEEYRKQGLPADYKQYTDEDRSTERQRKRQWENAAHIAASLGMYPDEELLDKGWYGESNSDLIHRHTGFNPISGYADLPPELYHVTTAKDAVLRDGLKTRQELAQQRGLGLGGGTDNTISFTTDPELAKHILETMHEAHSAARGDLTIPEMMHQAAVGYKAKRPYLGVLGTQQWSPGDPWPKNFRRQWIDPYHYHQLLGAQTADTIHNGEYGWGDIKGPGWEPDPDSEWNGEGRYLYARKPMTPDQAKERNFQFFKDLLWHREGAGGPPNPVFFDTDSRGFAKLDPRQFALLKYRPVPGARGYPVGGMNEWRVPTGYAVQPDITSRYSMALEPHHVEDIINQIGQPYLYHATSPQNLTSILTQGLKPNQESRWQNSVLYGRPDHVYLGTEDMVGAVGTREPDDTTNAQDAFLRANLNTLDPKRINADPESFWHGEVRDEDNDEEWPQVDWLAEEGHPLTEPPPRFKRDDNYDKTVGEWGEENADILDNPDILHRHLVDPDWREPSYWNDPYEFGDDADIPDYGDDAPSFAVAHKGEIEPHHLSINPRLWPKMVQAMLYSDWGEQTLMPTTPVMGDEPRHWRPKDWYGVADQFHHYLTDLGYEGPLSQQVVEYAKTIGADVPLTKQIVDEFNDNEGDDYDTPHQNQKSSGAGKSVDFPLYLDTAESPEIPHKISVSPQGVSRWVKLAYYIPGYRAVLYHPERGIAIADDGYTPHFDLAQKLAPESYGPMGPSQIYFKSYRGLYNPSTGSLVHLSHPEGEYLDLYDQYKLSPEAHHIQEDDWMAAKAKSAWHDAFDNWMPDYPINSYNRQGYNANYDRVAVPVDDKPTYYPVTWNKVKMWDPELAPSVKQAALKAEPVDYQVESAPDGNTQVHYFIHPQTKEVAGLMRVQVPSSGDKWSPYIWGMYAYPQYRHTNVLDHMASHLKSISPKWNADFANPKLKRWFDLKHPGLVEGENYNFKGDREKEIGDWANGQLRYRQTKWVEAVNWGDYQVHDTGDGAKVYDKDGGHVGRIDTMPWDDEGTFVQYVGYAHPDHGGLLHPIDDAEQIKQMAERHPGIGMKLLHHVRDNYPGPYYAAFANERLKRLLKATPTGHTLSADPSLTIDGKPYVSVDRIAL